MADDTNSTDSTASRFPAAPDETAATKERFDIAEVVVLSGWSLTLLVCISIIGSAVYLAVVKGSIDGPLKEWASTCLGFLFASFISMVKDFIKVD
jgi:hypothetical protein